MLNWIANFFRRADKNSKIVIRGKGRDEWTYQEGDHKMVIYAEMLSSSTRVDYAIYFGSIWKWLPPHDQKVLSWDERDRILRNFCEYLESRNQSYEIVKQDGKAKQLG